MSRWDDRKINVDVIKSNIEKLRFVNSISLSVTFIIGFVIFSGIYRQSDFVYYLMVGMSFSYLVGVITLFGMMYLVFVWVKKEEIPPQMKKKLLVMLFNLGIFFAFAIVMFSIIFQVPGFAR